VARGGWAQVAEAQRAPVQMLESGPAAGAIAAAFFGRADGGGDLLAFDMGGTTAKLSLVDRGEPRTAYSFEAARQKRFIEGSGLPIRISTIELIEIGAGGGSIARVDEIGLLKVGPRSAGSQPGPACYGLGGAEATVTDADLLLGYLNPDYFAGGTIAIDVAAARAALTRLARTVSLPLISVAWGIHDIVNESMASAARVHIAERGRDPRDYALLCTGGAGPVHACHVAEKLGLSRVICPPSAGVASALGLLVAPARVDRVATVGIRLDRGDLPELERAFRALEDEARGVLADTGLKLDTARFQRLGDGPFLGPGVRPSRPAAGGRVRRPRHRPCAPSAGPDFRGRVPGEVLPHTARCADRVHQHPRRRARAGGGQRGGTPGAPPRRRVAREGPAARLVPGGRQLRRDDRVRPRPARGGRSLRWPGGRRGRRVDAGGRAPRELHRGPDRQHRGDAHMSTSAAGSRRFDAVTLEVLWTRLISVVDEAAKAIVRTSFSTLSNEANDFACMLTDARGYSLAQNTGSIPSFIGTLPATVRHFLRAMGPAAMRPGDVLITNDAWMGTGHMSDVSWLKPIFRAGRLVAFSATTSHMPDIGGRLRAIEAREVFEEGLHIPLMKLIRDGKADDTLIEMIRANVRTPDQTVGDIWAQVG